MVNFARNIARYSRRKSTKRSNRAFRRGGLLRRRRFSRFSQGIKTYFVHLSLGVTTQKGNPSSGNRSSEFFHRISPRGPHVNPIKFTLHVAHHRARPVVLFLRSNPFLTTLRPPALRFSKFTIEILHVRATSLVRQRNARSLFSHPCSFCGFFN